MVNRTSSHPSLWRRCLQTGTFVTALLATISIVACDSEEETPETTLRSAQAEALEQTALAHSCADQFNNWESPQCEDELGTCSERAYDKDDKQSKGKKKDGKPKKWIRPLVRRAVKNCRPEFRECIDQGGDKATCKEEFRTCVKEFIHEHFDELCDRLLDRCDQADPRPKICDRIEKKCEEGLDRDR